MPMQRLRQYLEENHISYELIPHPETPTAQQTAAAAHVPGKELAKTVIVAIDGRFAMVVLPAPDELDLDKLKKVVGTNDVWLASEDDFQNIFGDCELGAMPPFGNLYDVPVFVDEHLREDARIAFNAGNHRELIRMPYADFERLVHPVVASLHA